MGKKSKAPESFSEHTFTFTAISESIDFTKDPAVLQAVGDFILAIINAGSFPRRAHAVSYPGAADIYTPDAARIEHYYGTRSASTS